MKMIEADRVVCGNRKDFEAFLAAEILPKVVGRVIGSS